MLYTKKQCSVYRHIESHDVRKDLDLSIFLCFVCLCVLVWSHGTSAEFMKKKTFITLHIYLYTGANPQSVTLSDKSLNRFVSEKNNEPGNEFRSTQTRLTHWCKNSKFFFSINQPMTDFLEIYLCI